MQLGLILICLALPLLELAVLIKVGQSIGVVWTILLLAGMAVAGGLLVRRQGFAALMRAMSAAREGRPLLEPVVDSALLMLAGLLFLVPGFLTDIAGALLLIPPLRRHAARRLLGRLLAAGTVHMETSSFDERPASGRPAPRAPDGQPRKDSIVIDGEWERLDEPPPGQRPPREPR